MKKILLTERFQQLAGIKPLYEMDGNENREIKISLEDLNFETLKNSFINFLVMVFLSVITAYIFFFIFSIKGGIL